MDFPRRFPLFWAVGLVGLMAVGAWAGAEKPAANATSPAKSQSDRVAVTPASPTQGETGLRTGAKPVPAKAAPADKETFRRLPAHYKDVISDAQREAIYSIQKEYGEKIAELKARLAELQSAQATKIDALLSPEQKQKIAQLKAAGSARRRPKPVAAKP